MDGSWDSWDFGKGKGWGPGGGGWFGFGGGKGAMKGGDAFGEDFKGGKGTKRRSSGGDKDKKGSGKGRAAARIAAGEPFYHGQVRSFHLEKKHGYVACESVHNMCGQDVYAFQDVLERSKAGPAGPGDTVAFFLHWSTRGQPQASSPLIKLSGPNAEYALRGVIKSGSASDRGFTFIECEETKDFFGRDVYLNGELADGLSPGQMVAFSVYLNRDGMPNVAALEPCDESWQPARSDLSRSWEVPLELGAGKGADKGKGKGKGKGKPPWGDADWGAWGGDPSGWGPWGCGGDWWGCGPQAFMALPSMDGAMGSKGCFKGDKGCFKGDGGCFKGDKGCFKGDGGCFKGDGGCFKGDGGCFKGEGGCFKGAFGFKGDVGKGKGWGGGGCGPQGPSRPVPTGRIYTGVIKSFNEATNYGFIACDEVKAEFGNDVFVHGKTLQGHSVGDAVLFEVGMSSRGQPQALNVQAAESAEAAEVAEAAEFFEAADAGPPAKRPRLPYPASPEPVRGELELADGFAGASGPQAKPLTPGRVQRGGW